MRHICIPLTLLMMFLFGYGTGPAQTPPPPPTSSTTPNIQPYSENPRYWQYEAEPILLLGGTEEDNLFQIPNLEEELNTLTATGGNYIRNTMSARDEGNVWGFHQQMDGKFDLEKLNEEYFDRLENLLQLAYEQDIIVQIELWDRFDFAREPWLVNPYRPENNINYTAEETGLKNEYPEHPAKNINPFFRSIPDEDNNHELLKYQEKRISRILDISLQFPNVIYVMNNETSANPAWGAYWSRFINDRAAKEGVEVQTTEMWDAWNLKDEEHKRTLDHPELYNFADISQNNHNKGEEHWNNLQWARNYVSNKPRPLNNVKIYGSATNKYGNEQDAVERFWRNLIGGSAAIRFHRPSSGIGLSSWAQANLSSARQLASRFDFFNAKPDSTSELLDNRWENEAYLSYIPSKEYAIYFTNGGDVSLNLRKQEETYSVTWLDIDKGTWTSPKDIKGGKFVNLTTPGGGQWIALIEKK